LDVDLENTRLHFKGQLYRSEKQRFCAFDTNELCLSGERSHTNIRLNLDHRMFLGGTETSLGADV
jgi:hypothetical protein